MNVDDDIDFLREVFLNEEVSGILFIRDYLEIQCEDKHLQITSTLEISHNGSSSVFDRPDSYALLAGLINHNIIKISLKNEHYIFLFDDKSRVRVKRFGDPHSITGGVVLSGMYNEF